MDYLEIILKGYFDETEKANLSDYLLEQFHKVESQTMTLKRFFDGCFNAIETLNKDIETKLFNKKEQLIYGAKNSEKNKDYFIDELKTISRNNFASTLPHGGHLWAKDIDFIHDAIQKANVKGLFDELGKAGNIYLDELKEMFFKKYGKPNQRTVTDELNEINNFIAKAESFSTNETFKSTIDEYKHSDINRIDLEQMFEYSRLKHDYYKNKENFSPYFTIFFNVQTTWVYSKYFLYKKWLEDLNKQFAPDPTGKPQPFSVLEWATIFYYADETKLLSENRLLKIRMEQFMSKHQINTTFNNFKTKYYEAQKRINEKIDYPVNKLELILPFLKDKYKQTVTKVDNDIIFLRENKPEY